MALQHRGGWDNDFFSEFRHPLHAALATLGADAQGMGKPIALDVSETPTAYAITADLPGVDKKDVKISVDGDVLSLAVEKSGAKEEKKEQNGVKYHRIERSSAYSQRRVRLPDSADFSKISAKMDNGVLKLDVPKQEQKVRQHTINVQ